MNMKKALIAALLLMPVPAFAQTTIDTAIVIPTFIAPNADGGIHIEGMALVKTAYGTCEAAKADAEAKMHAAEAVRAEEYGRTDWTPKSFARCYQERWAVFLSPSVSSIQPIACVRQWTENFDWFGPCEG